MAINPNIFEFATSELSQDAFICYLLSFGKGDFKNKDEYKIAHEFLEKCGIINENILQIKNQYKKIDILVETDKHFLIIEDKTYTDEHDNQIIHYVEIIQDEIKKKNLNKKVKVCYFKTDDYLHSYKTTNKKILSQNDCTSLRREDLLKLLQNVRKNNLIFDSFCTYWENLNREIDQDDISTWTKGQWFQYLKKLFSDSQITSRGKCDINHYVSNPSGGFYATHFNWKSLPKSYNLSCFDGKQNKKAETYKQIEIFFSNSRTSRINLAYRFHSNNWNRRETEKYKELHIIDKLQEQIQKEGYNNQNIGGGSIAYKIIKFKTINKENTANIKNKIYEFIKNLP